MNADSHEKIANYMKVCEIVNNNERDIFRFLIVR